MKKFLIIGNLNAISYKEIFPLIKDNKIWLGVTYFNGGAAHFIAPSELYDPDKMYNEKNAFFNDKGEFLWRVNGVRWYTNIDHNKRHIPLKLTKSYNATMKKFLIIGNLNAISYKEIFPLIKENKLWLGIPFAAGNAYFSVEDVKEYATGVYDETTGLVKFRNCHWFTNLDHTKRHEPIDLYKRYTPEEYPKYDNYDAINVDKVCDIPEDYNGVMGVPISFLDKYCPEQFEILGMMSGVKDPVFANGNDGRAKFYVNDKGVYARILIKSK